MGKLLSLDQVEKGKELRTALKRLDETANRLDKILVADPEGQTTFALSMVPTKEEVTMNINGMDYYENESFYVERENRTIRWTGAFDVTPALNVSEENAHKHFHWGYEASTVIPLHTEAVRIRYASEEAYDGLVDPDCVEMYKGKQGLIYSPSLKTERITDITALFCGCRDLRSVSEFDTKNVQIMRSTFDGCSALADVHKLDTSKVVDMGSAFKGCVSLETVPPFNTSKVVDMSCMFRDCSSVMTAPQLDTSKVMDMNLMFSGCSALTTVPQLDTSKVVDMSWMFSGCSSLATVPQLNTSKVTDMYFMFDGCSALTTVPQLDTSKVTDMNFMFNGCSALVSVGKLDLSSRRNDLNDYMFGGCAELQNISIEPRSIHYSISFLYSPKLTKASLLSILHGLGMPKNSSYSTLTLHATSKALLSVDELKIATDKGWIVA